MAFISVFDVLGPNMIGPSSSHTAGAEIIAFLAQKMIAPPLKRADFTLYGSFAKTYHGHGTARALLGGCIKVRASARRGVVISGTFLLFLRGPHTRGPGVSHGFQGFIITPVVALPVQGR